MQVALLLLCAVGGSFALNCACPAIYMPVCGSDGKTYSTKCQLECLSKGSPDSNLRIVKVGECESKEEVCRCPMNLAPICGSNGQTYPNKCDLECVQRKTRDANLKIAYEGECKQREVKEVPCICNRMFQPVCGSDGVTYGNRCEFDCHVKRTRNTDLKIVMQDECNTVYRAGDECNCPRIYKPVCASNGQTYSNECQCKCFASTAKIDLRVVKEGEC
ncbi:PREDICTED: serine protease inhibitor dipetalogastin-like [Nicrophorus vespilloides]|uniref:Serine protease inhibitor dipetalogastin-like n=1 Tax=Nicrophorus vespilloides TaxID=110193 RepID=A0ABM1M8W8_NICVS|nr:PREDICTED: serine protease inhibitor dipetalogastin-like [Nicrophorus vespilloides]